MSHLCLSTLFGDYAVFPKGLPICVFGSADTEGEIVLTLDDGECRTARFTPDTDGKFSVLLSAIDRYADDATLTVMAGDARYTASHIAIGIVLLAGGQSNMEFMCRDAEQPFPLYASPRMRFYTEKHAIDAELGPLDKPMSDAWYEADGKSELDFSAIGYFVAELLSRTLTVTVGVVSCNQGASRIEAWLSPEAVKRSGIPQPKRDEPDRGRIFNLNHWLYYNKYLPIAAYTYTAVLWYQGESNSGFNEAEKYECYLHELFAEWRENNPNHALPFYLVELAPFDSVKAGWAPEPLGDWAPVRAALVAASRTERDVYTVSLTEVADVGEIHPINKYPVAEKLFRAIMTTKYGASMEYAGPRLTSHTYDGETLCLHFSHAEELSLRERDGAKASALRDAVFITEEGRIPATEVEVSKNTLRVSPPAGAKAFLLGYHNVPSHNLYNQEGYLASPFRISLSE